PPPPPPEDGAPPPRLAPAILPARRAAPVDVAPPRGTHARLLQRAAHRPRHPLTPGRRRRHVKCVTGHAVAGELSVDPRAARLRPLRVLEHDERGALAEGHAPTIAVERAAGHRVEELEGVEPHEAD